LIDAFLENTCSIAVHTKIEKLRKTYSTAGQHSALSGTHKILKSSEKLIVQQVSTQLSAVHIKY
jgi:hypothetical protein